MITTEDAARQIAAKVRRMLDERAEGKLKKSADDFISGLIDAYAIITETNTTAAFAAIME